MAVKNALLVSVLSAVILISGCASQQTTAENAKLDAFAQCLSDNGVKMYGSYTCSICASQKKMFGSSFQYTDEIECHPRGPNSQYDLCVSKGIEATPTWVREESGVEKGRVVGLMTFEELETFGGCRLDEGP